jgi:hypothetical protein
MIEIDNVLGWPLFSIGDTRTTLGSLLGVVAIVLATLLLARLAGRATAEFFERLTTKGDKTANAYTIVTIAHRQLDVHLDGQVADAVAKDR